MTRKEFGERLAGHVGDGVDDTGATILHVDMDAFFVSVELLDRPELRGRPVIVGGTAGRGVVSTASYEARRFGVHSAMPMALALRRCPQAIVLPGDMPKYRAASEKVMAIFRSITPLVEPLSIDEAFLDVASARRLFGSPREIAERIRARVADELGLTCSVGAAATKFVAKLASGKCKPDGLLVVPPIDTVAFLHRLPVSAMWGVGGRTEEALRSRGITTVFDLAHTPQPVLERLLGRAAGERLAQLAWGRDPRPIATERQEKSVGHEETFPEDVASHAELVREIRAQADAVGARLRRAGLVAGTVALKLRWGDFTTISRSRRLERPSASGVTLYRAAKELLDAAHGDGRGVRLIGMRAESLGIAGDTTAATLWDDTGDEAWGVVDAVADRAAARFGRDAVRPASILGRGERRDGLQGLTERPNGPTH